ncbi:Pancreatic lipase-related protein 1 [Harpegnathos saltator]|uniref:phospholipase A1 n=1 Tax=Harpegnathos saltator TaxID=610380 RepID=E2BEW0_HARSA|nr:Pancreatic lipase-related protein 1 [Harpegnathos saltator]
MLPSPPKDVGTRFLVYGSRKARSIPMEVPADDINDKANRAIDPDLPTKVIVHGFGSDCNYLWVYDMRSALMSIHDCNIVCVDWGPGSAVPNYVRAAANTRLVGRQLAKLIRSLNVPLEKVHLIGFSLGAHVAGFAGAELGNVSRITGLDPAGPLFESQDPRARLDATDANFVDVIHSNGEQLILGGLGSWEPMGDVDYYPNGGKVQSGCSNLFFGAVTDIIWSSAVEGRSLCNHRRAYKLFTDSINPKCHFPAFPCDQGYEGLLKGDCFSCSVDRPCGEMGYYSNESSARGQLYLVTRDEEPFCAHQHQIKVYNSRSERSVRSYGKLQITFVGEGSYNDTFAMTRKDEELLVGSILQKIVVPHPAISSLEGIEIMYTAYSGWISSGLVSWTIDKVTIVDSFGKTMSVCRKGLTLESGRSVYLPLYPGECNIPLDTDNSTSSSTVPSLEHVTDEKKQSQQPQQHQQQQQQQQQQHLYQHHYQHQNGGIGPFTKEHNYETKEGYLTEALPVDRNAEERRGLGPFTKEQNLRISDDVEASRRGSVATNPWIVLDISNDGDSNSLENTELERGRGFSGGSNLIYRTSTPLEPVVETTTGLTTTEYLPEIREPVLRPSKKESGRSLKLPEITEPILRPRATRQNAQNEAVSHERQRDEIQETSSTSARAFTVQFLPERLAIILAQAERYARQTLLPLISQYTPSFVSGIRQEEPKYFPLLSDMLRSRSATTEVNKTTRQKNQDDQAAQLNNSRRRSNESSSPEDSSSSSSVRVDNSESTSEYTVPRAEVPVVVEAVYPMKTTSGNLSSQDDQWRPINEPTTMSPENVPSRRPLNNSRALDWSVDYSQDWTSRTADSEARPAKTNDWVPITMKSGVTTVRSATSSEETSVSRETNVIEQKPAEGQVLVEADEKVNTYERKFIPLVDLEETSGASPLSADSNDIPESRSSSTTVATHIQKIPRYKDAKEKSSRALVRSTMMFPYAYERRKDPRTRYIPFIPEEDMGKPYSLMERDR